MPSKEASKEVKREPTEWEKIFANYVSDKVFVYRICEEFSRLNRKQSNLENG